MTTLTGPGIALVDDDFHSARLMTRMLEAHGAPRVVRLPNPQVAIGTLAEAALAPPLAGRCMAVVDLKSSSGATRDFVALLKHAAPHLLVVAMAPSLDRDVRNDLLDAGASAVFERHSDISLYRREVMSIVAYWVRNQRLDAVGA
jgi:hypothetical protein